jgi:hypothetical protein
VSHSRGLGGKQARLPSPVTAEGRPGASSSSSMPLPTANTLLRSVEPLVLGLRRGQILQHRGARARRGRVDSASLTSAYCRILQRLAIGKPMASRARPPALQFSRTRFLENAQTTANL